MKKSRYFLFAILIIFMLAAACQSNVVTLTATATATVFPPTTPPTGTATLVPKPTVAPTPTNIPRELLAMRGVIGPFEHRGYPSGYYEGQILREFNNYDQFSGMKVSEDIGAQLDAMRSIGINTIWLTLSAADSQPGEFVPPNCTVNPDLGPMFPQPTETELTNLKALFDLINSKGVQIVLNLSNTNMEDQIGSETWLKSILEVVKGHPALYLVLFSGDIRTHDYNADGVPDACGGRAEPNLWEGPQASSVPYLKWALAYAHSLGIPYRKLSAEAILGFYAGVAQAPNQYMTDGHYWDPPVVLTQIFDDLGIPNEQRTYAISFYEHRKCYGLKGIDIPCEDEGQQKWSIETINRLYDVIGRDNGARVVAVEAGIPSPVETDWNNELAMESLIWLYQAYGIEGCEFWLWTYSENAHDLDTSLAPAIKQRGPDFTYNSVKDILEPLFTQGQTNDLKLTPDTTPPLFASINATPKTVKNGGKVVITANLGETHLFVWVNMTPLDSDKSDQVVLIDQGDGTYRRELSISPWNIQPNGVKHLDVTAMDFWSNVKTTVVDVELQNPTPALDMKPPNDDFAGTVMDATRWKTDLAGGATISQDGRAIVSTSSREKYSAGTVYATWQFPGNFDVQIDFQIGNGWQTPAEDHLDGAVFGVDIGGQRYWITKLRSAGGDSVFSMNTADQIIGQRYTDAANGKYRIIRQGSKLYLLFDVGAGWQRIASKTVPESAAQIYFGNGSINASQAFTTYFDHFHVNSGLTSYRP